MLICGFSEPDIVRLPKLRDGSRDICFRRLYEHVTQHHCKRCGMGRQTHASGQLGTDNATTNLVYSVFDIVVDVFS